MAEVHISDEKIVFVEKVSGGVRFFLTIIGLAAMFLAPYEFLFRPRWSEISIYLVIPALISLGAILLGGLFVVGGLFGLNQTITLVKKSRLIHYSYDSTLLPLRKKTFQFSQLAGVSVITHDWSDGPATHSLQFLFRSGQKIKTGSYEKKADAEQALAMVTDFIR